MRLFGSRVFLEYTYSLEKIKCNGYSKLHNLITSETTQTRTPNIRRIYARQRERCSDNIIRIQHNYEKTKTETNIMYFEQREFNLLVIIKTKGMMLNKPGNFILLLKTLKCIERQGLNISQAFSSSVLGDRTRTQSADLRPGFGH